MKAQKKLQLIELNEINFDLVNFYLNAGEKLPAFTKLAATGVLETVSESEYAELEPWIQWPSVHTGLEFQEHLIFRLGDFADSHHDQLFEKLERVGVSVGALSPMNAANKMQKPAYFVPDPWTQTKTDGSFVSESLARALRQAVNDNSSEKLTLASILRFLLAGLVLVSPARYAALAKYAWRALGKPWRKALFLDMLLFEMHKTLVRRKSADFSVLFLNAGAHIQHHYFFNSPYVKASELKNPVWYVDEHRDPCLEMLRVYDSILMELINNKESEFIIATGLSQVPYEALTFYYRLRDHSKFLNAIGIEFTAVLPRMTRDFLVTFESVDQAAEAAQRLSEVEVDGGGQLFGEIDNRGKELFVVLTYPDEITVQTIANVGGRKLPLLDEVVFVAIKNGKHQSKGFACFSSGVAAHAPNRGAHVSKLHESIMDFFDVSREMVGPKQ